MPTPAKKVASCARRGVVASGRRASTIPRVPPEREITPTMALSSAENMRIEALSVSAREGTMNVSTVRPSPASGSRPAMKNPPSQMPKKSDTTTWRKMSARAMAMIGGRRLTQPGNCGGSTLALADPPSEVISTESGRAPSAARSPLTEVSERMGRSPAASSRPEADLTR
ncbi:MAG: hypothetical protein F4012_00480 [Gemmatimonadales bacterium]|nr:hypothetical protein [Gemmatimonadales bacterium]